MYLKFSWYFAVFIAYVSVVDFGRAEINYKITLTDMQYMNGTTDDFYDYSQLIFKDGDLSGTVTLLIDITDDMTNYEGQMMVLQKQDDTGEYEPMISFGPDPWCEMYNRNNPILKGLKEAVDLPPKCPVSKGTYGLKKDLKTNSEDGPEELPRGEFALYCMLIKDDVIVSGTKTFFKIEDK